MFIRNIRTHVAPLGACLIVPILFVGQPAKAADEPIRILAHATHLDGSLVYHYEIINSANSGIDVTLIHIGERSISTDYPTTYFYEPAPQTPDDIGGFLLGIIPYTLVENLTAPAGWYVDTLGDTGEWELDDPLAIAAGPKPVLAPGQSGTVSVRLSRPVDSMIDTYFASRADGFRYYGGRVERRDLMPPTLTVKMSPSSVTKGAGTSLKVQAILTVTDDYDPQPAIKLQSITASVPVNQSEIKDAKFGTDDRLFILPVKKDPTGKPVVYTVTYSALDGTGNKGTRSATVTLNP